MNTYHRLMVFSWIGCMTIGCDAPGGKTAHPENTEFLRPDVFFASPNRVEGCVGLYTYDSLDIAFDSLDVDKGKKILATKTTEFAFLRLHHKDIYLPYDRAKSGPIDKRTSKEVYRGNDYTVVLTMRTVREEGESEWSTGTLEIIFKDKRLLIKVRGLSGC